MMPVRPLPGREELLPGSDRSREGLAGSGLRRLCAQQTSGVDE